MAMTFIRQALTALARRCEPGGTGTGIGVAAVDQQITRWRAGKVLFGQRDRRGTKGVTGKHCRGTGTRRDFDQEHILTVGLAHARRGRGQSYALHRERFFW